MRAGSARRARRFAWAIVLAAAATSVGMASSAALGRSPGAPLAKTGLTSHLWTLTPAGSQTDLGPGPQAVAVSPDGSLVVVANAGYLRHSLKTIDPLTGSVMQTIPAPGGKSKRNSWQYSAGHAHGFYVGLAFSPDGRFLYASDGPRGAVLRYDVQGESLAADGVIDLHGKRGGPWPAGIALTPDGSRLLVAGNLDDDLLVTDPSTRKVLATIPVGHLPYGVALDPSGRTAFVSNWGADSVSVVDVPSERVVDLVDVGLHPNAIATSATSDEIYVANGDADSVSVLSATTHAVLRTIDLRPYPGARIGASPVGLSVSPDGSTLYVANAGDNDVAVVELAPPGSSGGDTVLGLIPTGWWPSGVALDPSGGTIFVTNMKGHGVDPALKRRNNGNWKKPSGGIHPNYAYWIASMRGTLSRIAVPDAEQLAQYTAQVAENDRFGGGPGSWPGRVVPSSPRDPTPITHVIYVMKENRTYDQVLGDLGRGDGDRSLAIFGEKVTPNTHALARQFVTLDNFSSDGDVSVDGWSWSNGAVANDYLERNWPLDYGRYGRPEDFGGFGDDEIAGQPGQQPGRSYLWDELKAAGIDYENFGFFMDNPPDPVESMPGLLGHTDMHYPGWDLTVPDQVRMDHWLDVFRGYVKHGSMPAMQFVYLPSDHTWSTTPGARRPTAYVADNDYALGRLVDAVSHSEFWATTAIFVVEDDTQDGPDHVNEHRMPALVISPYTQTGVVDSTPYSTASALRTMELILGVGPMTQFDSAATPMAAAFSDTPDFAPFDVLPPEVSLWAKNHKGDPMSEWSAAGDFSGPDLMDPLLENEAIWMSVRGEGSQMPRAPRARG